MQIIKAVALSSATNQVLQAGIRGEVHSVFRRVMNLLCTDFLITLADSNLGELPNGLLLAMERSDSLDQLGVRPRMAVEIGDRRLFIPEARLGFDLSVVRIYPSRRRIDAALQPYNAWVDRLETARLAAANYPSQEGLSPLWRVLPDLSNRGGQRVQNLSPLMRTAWEPIRGLLKGVETQKPALVAGSVVGLAGLGIGLTPSGDDLLTGFLAAIVLVSERIDAGPTFQPMVSLIVETASGKTNQIAYQYLRQAAQGEVAGSLAGYIAAIVTAADMDITRETRQLFSYGATSGSELALGAYLGLEVMLRCIHNWLLSCT